MAVLSNYSANLTVNFLLRNTGTAPTAWYLALYLTNPTQADTGTEISGLNYARQPITFSAPSGGISSNTGDIVFPVANSNWGNITHAAIRSLSSGGNLIIYGPLTTPRFVSNGDILKFLIGNVIVTVN